MKLPKFASDIDDQSAQENSEKALDWLLSLDNEHFTEEVSMPMEIHRKLFNHPVIDQTRVGKLRSEPLRVHYISEGRVVTSTELTKPDEITKGLAVFRSFVEDLDEQMSKDDFSIRLAYAVHTFFHTHPFADGNGHVLRLIVAAICTRQRRYLSTDWTVHPRPYGRHFLYAIRHFRQSPYLLYGELSRYLIDPVTTQSANNILIRAKGDCSHCAEVNDLFEQASCYTKCELGDPEEEEEEQEFLEWLYEIFES